MRRLMVALVVCGLVTAHAARASSFSVDSSAFLNGGLIPQLDAALDDHCGGRNVSPPLRLTGAPAAARSLAVVAFDTDANAGRGFVHWVAYGIDSGLKLLPPGFGSRASATVTGGANDAGTQLYWGPCPPPGDPAHHYVFTVYALDLAPGRLPAGLTRRALLAAIARHTLAVASVTGKYAR